MFRNLGYKIHYTRGLDLASAATLPVDGTGDFFHVTGTTNITRIAARGKGMQVVLQFEDVLTLSHDDTYLILDNSSDIVTSAGMTLRFVEYDTGGKWKLIGGTGSDSGYFSSSGTSATLGDQLDNNGDFTTNLTGWTGTNWAWSSAGGGSAQHTPGSTSALTGVAPGLVFGSPYYGIVEVAGRTAGYVEFQIGAYPIPVSAGSNRFSENGTLEGGLVCYETGDAVVTVTPSSDFDGRINYIRFYEITQATPAITIYDDSSEDALDIYGDHGNKNIFIGNGTGFNSYNGTGNTSLGYNSSIGGVTGDDNTFIGANTGQICAIGAENTAVGKDAGAGLVTGISNTLIGKDAGKDLSIGYGNTCVGTGAGKAMISNTTSTFIGADAGSTTTYANGNTGVGYQAQKALTNGEGNTATGYNSMLAITEGANNSSLGSIALTGLTTGNNNTAVGTSAGKDVTTGSGNVFLGYGSGVGGTTVTSGIYIGSAAVPSAAGNSNEINIGGSTGPGSNKMLLGNSSITDSYIEGDVHVDSLAATGAVTGASATLTGDVTCDNVVTNAIVFPSTQVPESDPNTLDDYEEGTFTPTLECYGGSPTYTYTYNAGWYTKIGRRVWFRMIIKLASVSGTGGGNYIYVELPFTTSDTNGADRLTFSMRTYNCWSNSCAPTNWCSNNSNIVQLGMYSYNYGWTDWTVNSSDGFQAGSEISLQGTFEI